MIVVRPAASSALMLAPSQRALRTASSLPLRAARCKSKLSECCSQAIIGKGIRRGRETRADGFNTSYGGDRQLKKGWRAMEYVSI